MGMIEFCYRDSFFDLHSELRGLERELTSLIEADLTLDRLAVLVSRVESLEKDIEGLGLAPDLTIRREASSPTDFVRGGEWLSRWRSWRKVRRDLNEI
jgi:hypothetical protein